MGQEDGDPANGDLNKRQIFRLQAQTEQGLKKFQNAFIDKIVSPQKTLSRA
jgi:hypothetical protein